MKGYWLIGVLLCCMSIWARTPEQAACVASEFLSNRNTPAVRRMQQAAKAETVTVPVEIAYTQMQVDNEPAVYVFNGEDGFVMVSANDATRAILGYSDEGRFDAMNIPRNMQFWMQMYADEMARVQYVQQEDSTEADEVSYPEVSPILDGVEWNQDKPFNIQCPIVDGARSVTGCVATAISQLMYTYKYPEKAVGSVTYTLQGGQTVSATFDTVYDWENMLPSYNHGYSSEQADAVAMLMYHVGAAAHMKYTPYASATNSASMLNGLIEHFGYDAGIDIWMKDYMPELEVLTAMSEELQKGQPIYMSGCTPKDEGHAFICDGMQSTGYLHINWGWGGMANGYFPLSALDPLSQGIGGSASSLPFTESVQIFTGVCPDKGGSMHGSLMIADKLLRQTANKIGRNDTLTYALDYFMNYGINAIAGELGYYIYDAADSIVCEVVYDSMEVEAGTGWYLLPVTGVIPADLPNGEYTIEVGYRDALGVRNSIYIKHLGVVRMSMVVDSDSIRFEKMPLRAVDMDETQKIGKIDLKHINQSNEWEIDLYSPLFGEQGSNGDDILIRMRINSGDATSVIGSYLLDTTNAGDVGSIRANVLCMVGYDTGYCYEYTPTDVALTIAESKKTGAIQVGYYIKVNGVELTDQITINEPLWYVLANDECQDYSDKITYDLVSTLSASTALKKTEALEHNKFTKMSYFVEGIISNMRNTPEEIANYKTARFDISDDGSTNNQYYCYGTKWLDNSHFTTGEEIAVGDKVAIYGLIKNASDDQPLIKGYVYRHDKQSGVDDVVVNSGCELYDIMGRKVTQTTSLPCGIYIMRTGDKITTIYINKQ